MERKFMKRVFENPFYTAEADIENLYISLALTPFPLCAIFEFVPTYFMFFITFYFTFKSWLVSESKVKDT